MTDLDIMWQIDQLEKKFEDPDYDFMQNEADRLTMLNILLFRMNLSVISIDNKEVLKMILSPRRFMKKLKLSSEEGKARLITYMIMGEMHIQEYIVPFEWHEAMVEAFNDPGFRFRNGI